jgi:hypothetical protein
MRLRFFAIALLLTINLVILYSVISIEHHLDELSNQQCSEGWFVFDLGE